jgi:hypothetical protein
MMRTQSLLLVLGLAVFAAALLVAYHVSSLNLVDALAAAALIIGFAVVAAGQAIGPDV